MTSITVLNLYESREGCVIGGGALVLVDGVVFLRCLSAEGGSCVGVDSVESDSTVPEEDLVVGDVESGGLFLFVTLDGLDGSISSIWTSASGEVMDAGVLDLERALPNDVSGVDGSFEPQNLFRVLREGGTRERAGVLVGGGCNFDGSVRGGNSSVSSIMGSFGVLVMGSFGMLVMERFL